MKKFIQNSIGLLLKSLFCIVCYLITIVFAFCSGYFTVIFYSTGYLDNTYLVIVVLAGLFEFTKTLMSIAYPFMYGRNARIETTVRIYLRVALFMSILASLSFFLSSEVKEAPPEQIVSIIYSYLPFLSIIPLKFSQFAVTMSLSVFIEVLIIKVPSIAPVFFDSKFAIEEDILGKNKYVEKLKSKAKKRLDRMPIFKDDGEEDEIIDTTTQQPIVDIDKYREPNVKAEKKQDKQIPNNQNNFRYGTCKMKYNNGTPELHRNSDENMKASPIGFKTSQKETSKKEEIKRDDVRKYIQYMYNNLRPGNLSVGRIKMQKGTQLKPKQIDGIRYELEQKKIIEIKGRNTVVIDTLENALKKI